jgi:hypothetical protein
MQNVAYILNRQGRQRLHAVTAGVALALWLFLMVAEVWTPLHAWMHGGTIPENDHCAVATLHHGKIDVAPVDLILPLPPAGIAVARRSELPAFSPLIFSLPNGRAPPMPSVVS